MTRQWSDSIESELRRRGASTAAQLGIALGVTQSTISRAISKMGERRVLRIGKARASRYALRRPIVGGADSWPLYAISEQGTADRVGMLTALEARQWCLLQDTPQTTINGNEFPLGLFPDLPWFLDDLRPQGFLGRTFAKQHAHDLGVPDDPRQWRTDDILAALIRYGHDLPGAFILGDPMLGAFLKKGMEPVHAIPSTMRLEKYPLLANAAIHGEWPGSSAAGEQPKFTACVEHTDGQHAQVLVKFSGKTGRPEDQRWADLLAAEQLATDVLAKHGIASAPSSILDAGGRRFLESRRFDRVGAHGRRAVVSLAAFDSAFYGRIETPWTDAADRLQAGGWLTHDDARQLATLWWFGTLIGNTDMHYGNVSLYLTQEPPLKLAPCYDMLPMLYRPDPEGGLPIRSFTPSPPTPQSIPVWSSASLMADDYWNRLSQLPIVSDTFRSIAAENTTIVKRFRRAFSQIPPY